MLEPFATVAKCGANPERNPESNLRGGRRGISLWFARYRPVLAARGGALLLASSLARRIPRFFVRGGRGAHRPIPGPPAPSETTTAAAVELCTANAPVAYFNLRSGPTDAHASFSLITREMALESLPQLSASFSSCRRPAVSANSISRAAHTRKFSTRL